NHFRQRSGDRHQPTFQQNSHRSHGHHNDLYGSDRRGGNDNHRSSNSNYSGSKNRNSGYGRDQRNRGHQFNRSANSDVDTQESVVELQVLASSVVKLVTYRKIARRTPLQLHLVRLIRSGHNNDRHGSDRRGGSDNHCSSNNNYSGNNRNSGNGRDQRNRGQQSNRSTNSGFQQSRGPSKGYSYPVCTTCGCRHPGECRRATGTYFKCGQAGHLQKDCKKNTTASTSGQAD
nr:hypothetical protein [Tanacetum cinerariifolium]